MAEKPRICEILGVEVGEKFTCPYPNKDYYELWINEEGMMMTKTQRGYIYKPGGFAVCWMVNHPDKIVRKGQEEEKPEKLREYNSKLFAERLRMAIDRSGMNQAEVAARIGADRAAITRFVTGVRYPRLPALMNLAEVLGVSIDWLVGMTDSMDAE